MCGTLFAVKIVGIGYTTSMDAREIRVPNRGMRQTDVHMVRCVMSRYIKGKSFYNKEWYNCAECKWAKANGTYQWCGRLDSTARITADDFCSYGERKESE